ncbi:MAG: DNA import protein CedA1 [Acidilobaceae archaeon]
MAVDLVQVIDEWTTRITALAWALFLLTWSIGWALRGAPIPFSKVKRAGANLIEDSIWAAFWLAIGATIFKFITYVASLVAGALG